MVWWWHSAPQLYCCSKNIPWRRPKCWPKHVGENFENKIHRKYRSEFCLLFVYFWIWLMHGRRNILKCGFYCLCFCGRYNRSIETSLLQRILCFTDKSDCNVLTVGTVPANMQVSKTFVSRVIKLLLIKIWSCFRSTSKHTVEVMLPPVHATRHMCGTARTGTAALWVYWLVGGR